MQTQGRGPNEREIAVVRANAIQGMWDHFAGKDDVVGLARGEDGLRLVGVRRDGTAYAVLIAVTIDDETASAVRLGEEGRAPAQRQADALTDADGAGPGGRREEG